MSKIMVVEDEIITAEDLKDALESLGYEVPDLVSSGEDAVRKAGEIQPDLVLMDIKLEGEMDGIDAAEQIKRLYDIPIIYLTAYSDKNTLERAKKTEPSGYILKEPFGIIRKPFEESELYTAIEITLYKYNVERRLRNYEQWLPVILKSVNDAVIATDSKGNIKFMNPAAENVTGWTQEDAIDRNLDEVFKINFLKTNLEKLVHGINNSSTGKFVLTNKEGKKVPVNADANQINDEKGDIDGITLVFRKL